MIWHDEVYNYDRYEDEHNEESGKDEEDYCAGCSGGKLYILNVIFYNNSPYNFHSTVWSKPT